MADVGIRDGVRDWNPNSLTTLRGHFLDLDSSKHANKWDELWTDNFAPWDRGQPNPGLVDVLADRKDLFGSPITSDGKRKKALVPGCGLGYDAMLLAAYGYDSYGLEVSENALNGAKKFLARYEEKEDYAAKDPKVGRGKINFISGDFFKDDFLKDVEGEGKFDIIFDYTFLCALPRSLRPAWALRFSQLLAPTGRVICLEFPSAKAISSGGPPHALPPVIYESHLPRPGQELAYNDEGKPDLSKLGEEAKDGLVRLVHFKPKRAHPVPALAYDDNGNVLDHISVWAHKDT